MEMAKWHTFQVLTKRSDRMAEMLQGRLSFAAKQPHIWWGVSVEDNKYGVPRIKHLQSAPTRVRFLSVEPLLEELKELDLRGIHWVIVGGESGAGARPMQEDWVLRIQADCKRQTAPFFFNRNHGGHPAQSTGEQPSGSNQCHHLVR